jgi:hypothetical protein
MFKETAVEKLIEYIRALPEAEQKIIARKISTGKKAAKGNSSKKPKKKLMEFIAYTKKLPTRLPKNYKFDREEANER